jgi:hypothetical protein
MSVSMEEKEDVLPRKLTAEEIKQRSIAARQRVLEEHTKYKHHITWLEKRIAEVAEWAEPTKFSTKQKHHQLYKLDHELTEKKRKHAQLQRAIDCW